jgi:serine/threonine protein kinase
MSSDIEHWQINAKVFKDRVEEVHIISDPSRNVRREPQTKIWQIERFLGRGGFGEVRLERNKHDGKTRAVKRIPTTSSSLKDSDCVKELKALLEFSKPKVWQITPSCCLMLTFGVIVSRSCSLCGLLWLVQRWFRCVSCYGICTARRPREECVWHSWKNTSRRGSRHSRTNTIWIGNHAWGIICAS